MTMMMVAEKTHHCSIAVTRNNFVVVRTSDGSVCPDVRRQATKLADDGIPVSIEVDGMARRMPRFPL